MTPPFLPPAQITTPQIFILESLKVEDEENGRTDGRVLRDMLGLQGLTPLYYCLRTKAELLHFISRFRQTGFRYLFLSCHGSTTSVQLTLETLAYDEFADLFDGTLNNRRVFMSACSLGNIDLAQRLFARNGGMYSLTAPSADVFFDQSAVFWSSFFYLMNAWDKAGMKKKQINRSLSSLSEVFSFPIAHFFKNTAKGAQVDVVSCTGENLDWLEMTP